ncbi:glycoside hydrolase family 2 protein [Pedobacter glucosidilyticus]|uniref:glycoside hydrolase family 2 protein n=1 Tax=Pedobacter glucosidilyticus TaxID=1122941 RepID=UPI000426E2C4|nr:sugar-binding domain-containing protein [Pedobacter glucosidilyticus]
MTKQYLKSFYALIGFFLWTLPTWAQRDTILLNENWQFLMDKNAKGMEQKWFEKQLDNSKTINIPHTWNVEEENQNFYGWGWYQKTIQVPKSWKDKNVTIEFGAVNHTSYIYLNGKKIYENIGDGFNKFYVNLNGKLNYGQKNTLTVAVNNDYGRNKIPFGNSFDWPNDGGIIRKVKMIVSGKPAAAYLHASSSVHLEDESVKLKLKIGFDQSLDTKTSFLVKITEENQPSKKVIWQKVSTAQWKKEEAEINIKLDKVNLWHFDRPNLYKVDVTIINNKKAVDKIAINTGFRTFQFKNGKTYLNGEHIKLMGIEWTAGSNPNYGFAEPDSEIIRHARMMKNVNAIFSRLHFTQDDLFYDFCDRNGILLQTEVPLWGPETPVNDTIKTLAHTQLNRMVKNLYNHPSIFGWGVGNELRGRDLEMKKMISGLLATTRSLDPNRMTSYVSNTLKNGFNTNSNFVPDAGSFGDYLMMNEYAASWWNIPQAKLSNYLDSIHHSYPDKPFFISEFGLCEPNFKGGDKRRIEDLIYHMAVYESKPYVEGAIYFDLTDYRTHYPGTMDKNKFRRRIHGVYDMYGNPKQSMEVLREMSSPLEVQYMYKKRGKLWLTIFGSIGLPQHIVKGYKLYVSDKTSNYKLYRAYQLPEIKPGERLDLEIDDLFNGEGIVTVERPNGYVVTQKSFY